MWFNVGLLKVLTAGAASIVVAAHFAWIPAAMWRDREAIIVWCCWAVMEAQVALIAASSSSAFLGSVSHILFYTTSHNALTMTVAASPGQCVWLFRKQGVTVSFSTLFSSHFCSDAGFERQQVLANVLCSEWKNKSQILLCRFSMGFSLLAYIWGDHDPGIVDRSQVLLENEVGVSMKMFSQGKREVL